jgi:uncharacterized membrane protein YozB (DUF420 family)
MSIADLPHLNATLNTLSALLIALAYVCIRNRKFRPHGWLMAAATLTSSAFLVSYLIYHAHAGSRRFPADAGFVRTIYLTILLTHTLLAAAVVPMILTTLYRAARRQWDKHRRIATPTFWVWIYVSVTGVLVYWMLYHAYAPT